MRILVLLCCLTSFGPYAIASAKDNEENPLPTFVLAGQSNMVGKRCRMQDLPPDLQKENPNALFFQLKTRTWVSIAPGRTEPKGFGPEIAFASAMSKQLGQPIGIIKHSRGGTNLHRRWNPDEEKSLFGELVTMVKAANEARPIKVAGMLWVQGGADSKSELMANAYGANLRKLVTRARVEFDSAQMIFLSGRIPPKSDKVKPFWKDVRQAQQDLKMENYAWVNCDDITTGSDQVHYDTAGMVKLGTRQAEMIVELLNLEGE